MIISFVIKTQDESQIITSIVSAISLILSGMIMYTTDIVIYESNQMYTTNSSVVAGFLIILGIIMTLNILVIITKIVMNTKNKNLDNSYKGKG